MQIISFPAHYQSVYTNFDISSFSLISCIIIYAELQCKVIWVTSLFGTALCFEQFQWLILNWVIGE